MKIMTNLELIARMKELLNEPNYYGSGGNNWSSFINGWFVDCTCSIKAILWGGRFIPENRGRAHAGCNYGSNGVPDFTPSSCVNWIGATRGNFDTLVPGEILLMTSQGHAGLYIGNGEVIEVTPAWTGGNPGCQISKIGRNGERIKNGIQIFNWEYHGRIPVVEYINPTPAPTPVPQPEPIHTNVPCDYTIAYGDSLSEIAQMFYGNGDTDHYMCIANANGISNPNTIHAGVTIHIPVYSAPVIAPEPEPVVQPTGLKVGDSVQINGTGNGSSYGDAGTAYGIGWVRCITAIYPGRPFPYQVGNQGMTDGANTTGFYQESALIKL